ncbi:MAG: type II CRISPR RNA-guided endonuclease Cas9, partial [Lawsonibacter sp.]|nr:type II CRISPR RNA-guided endonuclease Cas9 [Lawsonibacter sp.]
MSGKQKPYLIGLDIGDASVGYAVTDINGRLLKHKKRNAWGVMLFDKAEPAHDRRISRSTRRRYDRKEHRIDDLQDLMADDVLSVDPAFYLKMNETFLHPEDSKYPKLYGSMPMHVFEADLPEAKYPTIYHIREALVTRTDQADIRYVYLALHHIMKYRGHFLFNDQPLASLDNDIIVDLQQVMDFLRDSLGYQITEDTSCAPLIKEILQATSLRGSEKRKQILQALQPAVDCYKSIDQLSALLIGQKANLRVLFDDAENEQLPEKISFSGELDEDALVDMLGSNADAFLLLQKIYRWQLFASLRKDGNTISHEMVLRYEKHKRNLALLKKVVRTYCSKTEYWSLFKDSTRVDGYCAYSAQGSSVERCEQEKFYKAIRALLTKERCSNDPDCQCILNSMGESNGFLPLQRINFNGNIPNQFHAEEMRRIIANQAEYYPTLRE